MAKFLLTEAERDRVRDLMASGPLKCRPVDLDLEAVGLVGPYDWPHGAGSVECTELCLRVFYGSDGSVSRFITVEPDA